MSMDSWWNRGRDNDFLEPDPWRGSKEPGGDSDDRQKKFSNSLQDVSLNSRLNPCTGSNQCPAGYACVNGVCSKVGTDAGGGQGQESTAGGCDASSPTSPCNSGGPNSCQDGGTCGEGDPNAGRNSCNGGGGGGTRCCRAGRNGVYCISGSCPKRKCTTFCDSYRQANGEDGPGCDNQSCDECSYCNTQGECKEKGGTSCWCGDGSGCRAAGECYKCDTDPNSGTYGGCYLDPKGCQECATIKNHTCTCGVTLDPVTSCKPYGADGPIAINLAQEEAVRRCEEVCTINPCLAVPLRVKRCCFADYGDCTFPSCDSPGTSGSTQTDSDVDENGYGCVTCEFPANIPDSCKDCDCNCENDCPDCEICAADGTCQPDPECTDCCIYCATFTRDAAGGGQENVGSEVCGFGLTASAIYFEYRDCGSNLGQCGTAYSDLTYYNSKADCEAGESPTQSQLVFTGGLTVGNTLPVHDNWQVETTASSQNPPEDGCS